jgi:hypothetical protein
MVLTIKKMFKTIYGKKYNYEIINEFKYIFPAQRVVATYKAVH